MCDTAFTMKLSASVEYRCTFIISTTLLFSLSTYLLFRSKIRHVGIKINTLQVIATIQVSPSSSRAQTCFITRYYTKIKKWCTSQNRRKKHLILNSYQQYCNIIQFSVLHSKNCLEKVVNLHSTLYNELFYYDYN